MQKHKPNWLRRRETITAYLMMTPDLLLMLVFLIAPIIYAVYLSFFEWNGLGDKRFIGMRNYEKVMDDSYFWDSFKNTAVYTFWVVILLVCLSLLLALMISVCSERMQKVFRTFIFMPHAVSGVVAGLMWAFIYDEKRGYINRLLHALNLPQQGFLSDSAQALYCIIPVALWLSLGYNMTVFSAALKEVPITYYEAAKIDGANALRRFWHITLPGIKNTTLFIFIVTTIGTLQVFELIRMMTGGGPGNTTKVAVMYIYEMAFGRYKFGYASAMAVILFLVIMLVTLLQFKVMGASGEEDGR